MSGRIIYQILVFGCAVNFICALSLEKSVLHKEENKKETSVMENKEQKSNSTTPPEEIAVAENSDMPIYSYFCDPEDVEVRSNYLIFIKILNLL